MSSSHRGSLGLGSSRGDSSHGPSSQGRSLQGTFSQGSSPDHVPTEAGSSNHGTSTKSGTKIYRDYQDMIDKWPLRSPAVSAGESGESVPHQYAGSYDKQPDGRISQDPLDWKVVKSMSKEERKLHIVARANFYSQTVPALIRLACRSLIETLIEDANRAGRVSMTKPPQPIRVNKPALAEVFHEIPFYLKKNFFLSDNRMNAEAIKSTMKCTREFFEGSDLEKRITLLLTRNLSPQKMPCKNIVAFGGYAMSLARSEKHGVLGGSYYRDWDPLRYQIEHAAVVSIHKTLERIYNTKLPVFLQDLNYTQSDRRAASEFEKPMKIVNGYFGFQEGWVEIDESTFFIDLTTNVDGFYRQLFEFTRPAAIFSVLEYIPRPETDWRKAPFVFHLQREYDGAVVRQKRDGPKRDYPGLGIKDYSAGIEKVLSDDYEIFSYDFDPPFKFLD